MKWNNTGKDFKDPEPGNYLAVLYKMVDLGTQLKKNFKGEMEEQHRVMLQWELGAKMEDGKPFVVVNSYKQSLYETSSLYKVVKGMLGRDLTEEETEDFDPKSLLGRSCMVQVVKDGKFINVDAVTSLPVGVPPLIPVNDLIFFSLVPEDFNAEVLEDLSDKTKAGNKSSKEYKALALEPVTEDAGIASHV